MGIRVVLLGFDHCNILIMENSEGGGLSLLSFGGRWASVAVSGC